VNKNDIRGYLTRPYARIIIPEATGGYSGEILEFPGCYAQGDTTEEVLKNLEEAAIGWIEASLHLGHEIPEPTDSEYSGRIALRLPKDVHKQAARFAERNDTSLNQFLSSAVASRVGAEEFYQRILDLFREKIMRDLAELVTCSIANYQFNFLRVNVQSSELKEADNSDALLKPIKMLVAFQAKLEEQNV